MEVIRAPNCAHNDSGNCPGVCSVRKQSKSSRRFLCVVPDALLPEANFLCPTLVETKSVGLGKYFDKVMSDAAACRNGRATQHGNSCWRMARSTSTRFATTAGPSLACLTCHFTNSMRRSRHPLHLHDLEGQRGGCVLLARRRPPVLDALLPS